MRIAQGSMVKRASNRVKRSTNTRDKLLSAAIKVFAKDGYDGGRVEKISKLADTYDQMIYYYFGSKEKLFVEVIETIYLQFNLAEKSLSVDMDNPTEALSQLVDFHWEYYIKHPEFAALLNSENARQGKLAKKSARLTEISSAALSILDGVLQRGRKSKLFHSKLNARDVFIIITSLGYYYNSNRYTLSAYLGENLMEPAAISHWRDVIQHTVMNAVLVKNSVADTFGS